MALPDQMRIASELGKFGERVEGVTSALLTATQHGLEVSNLGRVLDDLEEELRQVWPRP